MEFKDYFNKDFLNKVKFKNQGRQLGALCDDMTLICGDFYGIQKFIFENLGRKNAAKVLRAKSAFVQVFTEIVAKFICREFDIDEKQILSKNAGKFEILALKAVPQSQINEKIQKTLDEFFITKFYGIAGMSVIAIKCQKDDFKPGENYKAFRQKVGKVLEKAKFGKFSLVSSDKSVLSYDENLDNQSLCKICNMRKKQHENCEICEAFIKFGQILATGEQNEISGEKLGIDFAKDISVKLDERIRSYVPYCEDKDGRVPKDFETIANADKSKLRAPLNALAIIKADVDGMGNFINNSDVTDSYDNFDLFSQNLDAFFALYVPKIIKEKFEDKIYVVFTGGDDLFVLGEWKAGLEFARVIRSEFLNFVKPINDKGEKLSISFGICLAKPSTPISYLATTSEEWLENAKAMDGKDAIYLFKECVKWDKYLEIYEKLNSKFDDDVLSGDDDKTAFFYRLLEICDMSKMMNDGGKIEPKNAMWRSKLHYSFNRNISHADKKQDLFETLNTCIGKNPKESKMTISEIIYKRREK